MLYKEQLQLASVAFARHHFMFYSAYLQTMSQRAILVGAEPKPWITGTPEDVLCVWCALINVYGKTNVEIQLTLSLPIAPPVLVPIAGNVWREVYDTFS
jgi:hypothetical protein